MRGRFQARPREAPGSPERGKRLGEMCTDTTAVKTKGCRGEVEAGRGRGHTVVTAGPGPEEQPKAFRGQSFESHLKCVWLEVSGGRGGQSRGAGGCGEARGEGCPGRVPSARAQSPPLEARRAGPRLCRRGFEPRVQGSEKPPSSPGPPPATPTRLPLEVRACQHVAVGLHAASLRPQRRTPADGRGLHQQPPRYCGGWGGAARPCRSPTLSCAKGDTGAHTARHTLGTACSQHMALFVSSAVPRTRPSRGAGSN